MNITDFNKVQDLVTKLKKNEEQQLKTQKLLSQYLEGGDDGYWGCFSEHKDGSGASINLTGCGVGVEVVEAILKVLTSNIETIQNELKAYNVTF